MDGVFSMKSDIYSFGVMVLEIITGKRNRGFYEEDLDLNLLRYVRNTDSNTELFLSEHFYLTIYAGLVICPGVDDVERRQER